MSEMKGQDVHLDEGLMLIPAIKEMKEASKQSKIDRLEKNRVNRDIYLGRQDWSHKQAGQSSEFIPKVSVSVEQMGAFIKKALVQISPWYNFKLDASLQDIITPQAMVNIYNCFLENLWAGNNKTTNIATVVSDAVKVGMLESLMVVKVHGAVSRTRRPVFEQGETLGDFTTRYEDDEEWRLRMDLVRSEDYFPDPTGNGLYEIHTVERDLHEVIQSAKNGMYDMDVVNQLVAMDHARPEDEKRTDRDRNQNQAPNPQFRKRVVIDEFWGTILKSDGTVAHHNVVAAVANDKFLIRKPEPNPFWHQESPFVAEPLIRVPWSVWHKALYDDASQLNLAINEMFNLMLDGGLAAVWGIKQIRLEDLEEPSQVAGGIPQGTTLAIKSTVAPNVKVVEQVTEGDIPQDAMAMYELLNREFTQAALTNELKLGSLPGKQVRATEIMEASQSQSVTLEGITSDLEPNFIDRLLMKGWHVVLQNADRIPQDILTGQFDKKAALLLMRASAEERYQLFAGRGKIKATGLTATMSQMKDFQRMMAFFQVMGVNPALQAAFLRKFSAERSLRFFMQILQIKPEDFEKDEDEMQNRGQELEEINAVSQIMGMQPGSRGKGMGQGAGSPGMQGQINQQMTPVTGSPQNA